MPPIPSSEITPEALFWNRRRFIQTALAGAALTLPACTTTTPVANSTPAPDATVAPLVPTAPRWPRQGRCYR
jgi:sulfoxide reductase catalytic subunit YedY